MRTIIKTSLVSLLLVGTAAQADTFYNTQLANVTGTNGDGNASTVTDANGTVTTVNGSLGSANRVSAPVANNTWLQMNVGGNASVGITTERAKDGNGSIAFVGATSAKADLEYYFDTAIALSDFQGASYDWFRSSASGNNGIQTASLRLLMGSPSSNIPALIFEPYYQTSPGDVAEDQWVTSAITTSSIVWANNTLTTPGSGVYSSLAAYMAANPNAMVYGLSTGIGSGWNGPFYGGVDNISVNFGDSGSLNFNFEVAVPEPGTWAMMIGGFGVVGMSMRRRTARAMLARA